MSFCALVHLERKRLNLSVKIFIGIKKLHLQLFAVVIRSDKLE